MSTPSVLAAVISPLVEEPVMIGLVNVVLVFQRRSFPQVRLPLLAGR